MTYDPKSPADLREKADRFRQRIRKENLDPEVYRDLVFHIYSLERAAEELERERSV